MSTRSNIAIKMDDGRIRAIYCHYDGYLECVGEILAEHYTDPEKINALIDLGAISSLYPEVGDKHSFKERRDLVMKENEQIWADWTLAYHRDRGDDWSSCAPKTYNNMNDFVNDAVSELGANFVYLWDREWTYCTSKDIENNNLAFEPVSSNIEQGNEKDR